MTTHTAEGLRPSPRPRPDDGDPGRSRGADPGPDQLTDPWTDWSWPDAGWTRSAAAPDHAWAGHTLDGHTPDGHTPDGHTPDGHRTGGLDHLDPGRAGWLPLLDDVADEPAIDLDRSVDRDPDRGDPEAEPSGTPSRRRRRVVGTLGLLAAVSVGFLGGVVADRVVTASGDTTVRLAGEVEADADGTLAVRGADGALTAVRTSTGTRVVTANPVAGDLPAGTMVDVWTRRAPDGALEATAVAVRP